jgi:hypothetical protein
MAEQASNYDIAVAHLGPDDGFSPTVEYDIAAAQVRALLAVADELRALRKAVTEAASDVTSAVNGLDGEHSNLRWINNWLKDLAEKR